MDRSSDRRDIDAIICNGNQLPGDAESFFGPGTTSVHFLPKGTMLSDILVMAGVFPTKTKARKAGYHELEPGFTDMTVGKFKTRICVLNPLPEEDGFEVYRQQLLNTFAALGDEKAIEILEREA